MVTKYLAVRDQLLDMVRKTAIGSTLASERDLSEKLGVSRVTVRRALDELQAQGVVERRQGAGTFVSGPKMLLVPQPISFSEQMNIRGVIPGSLTLRSEEQHAGAMLAELLKIPAKEMVRVFTRLRLVDGTPVAVETLHVPVALTPGLTGRDLEEHSFYSLLENRYGIHIAKGSQTVEASITDHDETQLFGLPSPIAAFRFELTTETAAGLPVEFVRGVHRSDRLKLRLSLTSAPVE